MRAALALVEPEFELLSLAALKHELPWVWARKLISHSNPTQAHYAVLCAAFFVPRRLLSTLTNDSAACREVWEFLSAWSELYGITADAGFLRAMSQKIQGANHSVRRYTP